MNKKNYIWLMNNIPVHKYNTAQSQFVVVQSIHTRLIEIACNCVETHYTGNNNKRLND